MERILARLEGVEEGKGYYKALCPVHDDHNPSLNIKEVVENGQTKLLVIPIRVISVTTHPRPPPTRRTP